MANDESNPGKMSHTILFLKRTANCERTQGNTLFSEAES
jgi:hypothetical protein